MSDHRPVQEDERARDRMIISDLKHRVDDLERGELAMRQRVRELEKKYADLLEKLPS